MFFPVSDAASVAGQWLAAGVLTMADLFGIPWQLLAVSVIYTVIYTTANVGHGVLWLCVRLRAAAAGCEWSASSGSAFCRRGGRGCGGTTCRHFSPHPASPPPAAAAAGGAGAPAGDGAAAAAGGAAAAEDKDDFTIMLVSAGDKKINVIKEVRAATSLGLKEAKDLVEGAPKEVKAGVPKKEAEEIKAKLEAAGAKVELK